MQKHRQINFGFLLLLFTAPSFASDAPVCTLERLSPQGSAFEVRGTEIDLGEADDSQQPQAWQGPVSIKQGDAPACAIELNIIEAPLTLVAGRYLYMPTYSGSERQLHAVDIQACTLAWSSEVFFGTYQVEQDSLLIRGEALHLGRDCLPEPASK